MTEPGAPETPDFEFRPLHYNDFPDPVSAVVAGVHGSRRREMIRDVMASEGARADQVRDMLGDLNPHLMEAKAHPAFVDWMSRLDTRWIGGEELPPDEPGEVEIARITLENSLREVTAIRARRDAQEEIYRYRIVDDHSEHEYHPDPATSDQPLSLRELVRMLDTSTFGDSGRTLAEEIRHQWELGYQRHDDLEDAARYVQVTSELYPELERTMTLRWEQWLEGRGEGAA
jgi:hypothetical protein